MTKQELVFSVARRSGVDSAVVEKVLNSILNEAKESVVGGKTIYIRGFGTLGPRSRKEKIGQNIRSGQSVVIPAQKVPYFKPSKVFKHEVNLGRILKANEF